MIVAYVAGPFRGESSWDIECNIRRAEALSLEVWRLGAVGLCPHTNTRFFQNAAPDYLWLEGDLELLRRSDALILTEDWERSSGARAEKEEAERLGIPVFYELSELKHYLEVTSMKNWHNPIFQEEKQTDMGAKAIDGEME